MNNTVIQCNVNSGSIVTTDLNNNIYISFIGQTSSGAGYYVNVAYVGT